MFKRLNGSSERRKDLSVSWWVVITRVQVLQPMRCAALAALFDTCLHLEELVTGNKSVAPPYEVATRPITRRPQWDKDRIGGSAKQSQRAAIKETAGKALGDKKLETEGKTEKAAGKLQNAIGGLKDAVRRK